MNRRRAIAVLSLIGILDSAYLLLAKLGYIGSLSCTVSHGCDMVNASLYSVVAGVPVATVGLVGYALLLVIALVGLQQGRLGALWPDQALTALSGVGLLFALRLTYHEVFDLHALCQWCLVSQIAILLIFLLAARGLLNRSAARETIREDRAVGDAKGRA